MKRLALGTAALALVAASDGRTLVNPVLPSGADPWVVEHGGTFYFMATRGDRLAIRAVRDLSRLSDAAEHVVWRAPATGPNSTSIWAPELHRIDGRWLLYYTASDKAADDDAHRGVWVLENRSADPTRGEWIDRGRINTARPGIDGTTFTVRGRRYFAYSPYVGPDSVIAIARMANPWTLVGDEAIIARPDQAWERQGGRQILEGPAFLQGPDGSLHLAYSGSACWSDDYALGLLSAAPGADPMRPASWRKAPRPVLAKSPATRIWAPGHNGFFAARGRSWIIYHANNSAGQGCGKDRAPHIQEVTWSRDGKPILPRPATGKAPAP